MPEDKIKTGKILIVDDNEDLLKAARIFLKRNFKQVDIEKTPDSIPTLLKNENYDVILLDMNFTKDVSSGHEGFLWLEKILEIDPSAVVILITAYGDVQMAVKAIKEGAMDFILKPWENERLLATVNSAMQLRKSKMEVNELKDKQKQITSDIDHKFQDVIGSSSPMQRVFQTIDRVATTDANVLILGENGTGKEVIARAIHRNSNRKDEIFISVDLGAISETLFESELFGHVKGAFTDAKDDRPGRFEVASGGTLFLDEIGNLSLPLQAKLLSALQNRSVTRVGSNKSKPIDIRLICATNLPIYEIPPLRDRKEDIDLLVQHFLQIYTKKYNKNILSVNEAARKKMMNYSWPGNVRELQHAIERAVIMGGGHVLNPEDFFFSPAAQEKDKSGIHLEDYHLEEVEKILIRKVLQKFNGNITQAANELGLTRSSLYRRLEKYGL
jgi:DNA-binding NtrC family response regulator